MPDKYYPKMAVETDALRKDILVFFGSMATGREMQE
jgi:hypothetical protein